MFKKYDIIHLHYFFPFIILAVIYKLFHSNTKVVVTFHGSDITSFINTRISKYFFSRLLARCDYIISVGSDLSKLIEKKLNKKPNLILSAGIDSNTFYKEKNINKEFDFIFVGSFIKRKGLDILLESIKKVNNKNIKYCIVGSGFLEKDVLMVQTNYNIVLLKNQSQIQLRTLYNKSNFFILPSRDEPFGLVVSESLFCGTPAIVSNIGGMVDQVENNFNGFILKENTSEELSKVINKLINIESEEYNRLALNASKSNKQYSMNNVCMELSRIYKELLDEN